MIYRTVAGDMLDAICFKQLGAAAHSAAYVAAVLAANPRLADLGAVLPAGVLIDLPQVAAPIATGRIRLWGAA